MKLDAYQVEQFHNYWGRCPFIHAKTKNIVTFDEVRFKGDKVVGTAIQWNPVHSVGKDPDGNVAVLDDQLSSAVSLEEYEPYFVNTGFYQLTKNNAYWINRKTDRGQVKGMSPSNTDFKLISPLSIDSKEVTFTKRNFNFQDLTRISHQLLNKYQTVKEINEFFDRIADEEVRAASVCLSPNVCVVHSKFDIPTVFYKLNPIGYYMDGKIFISRKKDVSKETVTEETNVPIEIYG